MFFFSSTVTYSALLVKTNRVDRIFRKASSNKPVPYTGARQQILFAAILILLQVGGISFFVC